MLGDYQRIRKRLVCKTVGSWGTLKVSVILLYIVYSPYLDCEIRVKDVIIRIYNKNPAVYIIE